MFAGTAASILGDQFYLIATPWLVLQMTDDPLALGIVIALGGIPRAVMMLLGGAVTDRFSPRVVMIAADILRLAFTGLLAMAVFSGEVQIWMLYAVSLGFGIVAGFAIPAGNSIVPLLVEDCDLQAGNSVILGTTQIAGFVGPTLAGLTIGGLSESLLGVGLAYAVDAASFAASAVALLLMISGRNHPAAAIAEERNGIWASILMGMKYLWDDRALRLLFMVVTAVNFLIIGPVLVGIPVLANNYLPEGAVAYGLLMSAVAGGNLAGYVLAAQLPRPNGRILRIALLAGLAVFGAAIGSLGFLRSTPALIAIMCMLGLGNGYLVIMALTWFQSRTPREMLGRMMSMVMLSIAGMSPVSQALSGAVIKWDIAVLFIAAGIGLILVPIWASRQPELKTLSESFLRDLEQGSAAQ